MPMTRHYPGSGYSASDWIKQIFRPIRSTTHIRAVTRHQYGISALKLHFSGIPVVVSRNVRCFPKLLHSGNRLPTVQTLCSAAGKTCSLFEARESIQPWFGVERTGKCTFFSDKGIIVVFLYSPGTVE